MTSVITTLGLGAGLGAGLWALAVYVVPPRPDLGAALARAAATAPAAGEETDHDGGGGGWAARIGRPAVGPLRALGLPGVRLDADLAVLGRSSATHLAEKATFASIGLLSPALLAGLLAWAGLGPGVVFPVVAGLVLAGLGFLVPDVRARAAAKALRVGFRHALSAYLDLVRIALAGGAGVDSALGDAVRIGYGWAFGQLRRALDTARLTRTSPWTALRRLGLELDVAELTELAASVSLAGTEGAKVRTSLSAKAQSLRTHQVTDAEGDAHAATERMSLPVMALFLGFLIFIAYPAIAQVLDGL